MTGLSRPFLYFALILIISTVAACGKKTDPIPPQVAIPKPVSDLAHRFSEDKVVLEWTYPDESISGGKIEKVRGFILRKSDLAAGNYCPDCPDTVTSVIKIDPISSRSGRKVEFRDSRLLPGHHYSYTVISDCGWNIKSLESNRISFWWQLPPGAPDSIKVEEKGEGAEISWKAVEKNIHGNSLDREVGYQVYRKSGAGKYELLGEADGNFFYDHAVESEEYLYLVRAAISYKETVIPGPFSETVRFIPADRTPPPIPEIISVIATSAGPRLLWQRITAPDLAGYRIYRRQGDSGEWNLIGEADPHAFSFTDESLSGHKGTWYYRITSFDQASPANESDYSREMVY